MCEELLSDPVAGGARMSSIMAALKRIVTQFGVSWTLIRNAKVSKLHDTIGIRSLSKSNDLNL